MSPSLTDPRGSLRAALTPGRSRDVDWGGCVVVSVVPTPQEIGADPQSARPAQGLHTPHLEHRHCQHCPPRATLLPVCREQRCLQERDRIPNVSPAQSECHPLPLVFTQCSGPSFLNTNFYRYK